MDDANAILERLKADPESDVSDLITKYQLRPTLLDPIIPKALELLTSSYLESFNYPVLHTIYTFARVRGYKLVLQNFPTDIQLLLVLPGKLVEVPSSDWQSQYALLLWLAADVLVPFDLDSLDPELNTSLFSLGLQFLPKSGIQRDAAAILVARLLTRSASAQSMLVNNFIADYTHSLEENPNSFASIGLFQTLAQVMDRVVAVPESVEELVIQTQQQIESSEEHDLWFYNSTLTARLWLKILCRSALRDVENLGEFAVSECISLFDHKSSQVRMAAAKYVARLAQKIDPEAVQEVCESIISSLEDDHVQYASADYWNGALIALAEILRRAQKQDVHEELISRLVHAVLETKGLHFVQERIRNNIGANVRDAACYVCWSLFRSRIGLTQEIRNSLYSSLITLACLDSEVNIRRAAAAALQEGLGRYGSSAGDMPAQEMFAIMEDINLYTVSSLNSCYFTIAPKYGARCSQFIHGYIAHGVNSANPDVRRLAAKAAPSIPSIHIQSLIDFLLNSNSSGDDMEEDVSLHGKLLTLGYIYTNAATSYRLEDSKKLLNFELARESDLVTEAMLKLVSIEPEKAPILLDMLITEESHVIAAAQDLISLLPESIISNEVVPLCTKRLRESRLFVACLVRAYKLRSNPILVEDTIYSTMVRASTIPDPLGRALVVQCLDTTTKASTERLHAALNDYSEDERGDVGAWVREAGIARVCEIGLPANAVDSHEFKKSLWLMASESRQKLRLLSGQALFRLGLISQELNYENTQEYFTSLLIQCPEEMHPTVASGLASSVGALRASAATIHGSLNGLLQFMMEQNSEWVLENIMRLDRNSNSRCLDVVRTLKRVIIDGIALKDQHKAAVLAIAYNTTLNIRLPEQIVMDAIDILQIFALLQLPKSRERLIALLRRHPNGRIRQRSADALFEIGIENEVLETTDWTSRTYVQYVKKLNI